MERLLDRVRKIATHAEERRRRVSMRTARNALGSVQLILRVLAGMVEEGNRWQP